MFLLCISLNSHIYRLSSMPLCGCFYRWVIVDSRLPKNFFKKTFWRLSKKLWSIKTCCWNNSFIYSHVFLWLILLSLSAKHCNLVKFSKKAIYHLIPKNWWKYSSLWTSFVNYSSFAWVNDSDRTNHTEKAKYLQIFATNIISFIYKVIYLLNWLVTLKAICGLDFN